jgi:hypothetical protein
MIPHKSPFVKEATIYLHKTTHSPKNHDFQVIIIGKYRAKQQQGPRLFPKNNEKSG